MYLGATRRRFAGAERGSRVSQEPLNPHRDRVRATKYAPRDPCSVLERRHGLEDVVERGAGVLVERLSETSRAASNRTRRFASTTPER
jgi:hypothetical protein